MISQTHVTPDTPMGATLVDGGVTFRAWAPRALAIYVNGTFGGAAMTGQSDLLMARDPNGYWTGFVAGFAEMRSSRRGRGGAFTALLAVDSAAT